MKLVARLRLESCGKLMIPFAALCFFALLLFVLSGVTQEEPQIYNLEDVSIDSLEGKWVTFDVEFLYGCYAYEEQTKNGIATGEILSKSYLFAVNEDYLASLTVRGEDIPKADALVEESFENMLGEIGQVTNKFSFLGQVKNLNVERTAAIKEAIAYDALDPETQLRILFLDFSSDTIDAPNYVLVVISIFMVVFAVVLEVMGAFGFFQRALVKKANELTRNEPERLYAYLYERLKSQDGVHGVYVNGGLLFIRSTIGHLLYGQQDLVWAYQKNTTKKLYGVVTTEVVCCLVLGMANGKIVEHQMRDTEVKYVLKEIWEQFPNCAQGYSSKVEQVFQKMPNLLKEIAQVQHSSVQQ